MKTQAQEWADMAKNGGLHKRDIWFLMRSQLWARVGFGLGCSTASLPELESVLSKQYYNILPLGGVIRSSPRELRMLDIGYGGIGCPHPGIEALVGQLNKLSMHYGCQSSVGVMMQASMEYFILQLGLTATEPFSYPFQKYGGLVTHCWLKTIWEKCSRYAIRVEVRNVEVSPPRTGDKWLNQALIDAGYRVDELIRLNRVRIHQQVLFLSDVLNANGRSVDLKYTDDCVGRRWSSFSFPIETPTEQNFQLWNEASTASRRPVAHCYGLENFGITGTRFGTGAMTKTVRGFCTDVTPMVGWMSTSHRQHRVWWAGPTDGNSLMSHKLSISWENCVPRSRSQRMS